MPNQQNKHIPEKGLKKLEDKITKRTMDNIGNLVTEKCKIVLRDFHASSDNEKGNENPENKALKERFRKILIEMKNLHEISDQTIGSLSYIAKEYDDILQQISKLSKKSQNLTKEINHIKFRQTKIEKKLDQLKQYDRRENLEIHGIPKMKNENTNQIVKSVAKCLNVQLDDVYISTSHRLIQNPPTNQKNILRAENLQLLIHQLSLDSQIGTKRMKFFKEEKCLVVIQGSNLFLQ